MLLFIIKSRRIKDTDNYISIHLMLLFIRLAVGSHKGYYYFNTSHVTVYLLWKMVEKYLLIISIHLMLLFIATRASLEEQAQTISIHLMLLFIDLQIIFE